MASIKMLEDQSLFVSVNRKIKKLALENSTMDLQRSDIKQKKL